MDENFGYGYSRYQPPQKTGDGGWSTGSKVAVGAAGVGSVAVGAKIRGARKRLARIREANHAEKMRVKNITERARKRAVMFEAAKRQTSGKPMNHNANIKEPGKLRKFIKRIIRSR